MEESPKDAIIEEIVNVEETVIEEPKGAEQVNHGAVEASDRTAAAEAGEASEVSAEKEAVQDTSDQSAVQAKNDFPCLICDFVSNWESGLLIHMSKKHSMMEQVYGNVTLISDDLVEDDKYADTCQLADLELRSRHSSMQMR